MVLLVPVPGAACIHFPPLRLALQTATPGVASSAPMRYVWRCKVLRLALRSRAATRMNAGAFAPQKCIEVITEVGTKAKHFPLSALSSFAGQPLQWVPQMRGPIGVRASVLFCCGSRATQEHCMRSVR